MKPYRAHWRFHGRPFACAFLRELDGRGFYSLCGRFAVPRIGGAEVRGGRAPSSFQRCPMCDSRNGGG